MEINKEIIQRYHLGLCSPKETAAVEAWLESEQADMTFLEEEELQALENTGWMAMAKEHNLQPIAPAGVPKRKKINFRINWQIAASITVLIGLSTAYLMFNSNRFGVKEQNTSKLSYKSIRTRKGEKLQVTLPDGTRVWINSESTLRFPEQFGQNQRAISFTGEGYFRVAKDPKKPFLITTSRTKVQVLGTRFNLRDYMNETMSSVVVEEGKVRFSGINNTENLILTANKKGNYTPDINQALVMQTVYNTSKYIEWKDNKLVLDNLTILEIVAILERWYGIRLIIADQKLNNKRYTGSFENPNVKQVIESISFALKANYQQQKNTWTLYK